jgi:hypothetical protein
MRTLAGAVLALTAATLVRAPSAQATTAADICPDPMTDPCLLETVVTVTPGSTLDFGTRAFVIKAPDGRLDVGTGDTVTITAGSMTVEAGPGGRLRSDGECTINIDVAGAFAVAQGVGVSSVAIDLSAKAAAETPCALNVTAGGDTTIAAEIQARGNVGTNDTFASAGGDLFFQSAGRLTVSDRITVTGPVFGGFVELDAPSIEVAEGGSIDASDMSGEGDILLDADDALTMRGKLDVDGNGERPEVGCDGGSIVLLAGGDITIAGAVSGTGATSGEGCFGGSLEMTAGRDVLVNARIDFSAGANGQGGFVEEIVAGRDFLQTAPILVNAGRIEGSGGVITIRAARRLHAGALLDLSGGSLYDPERGALNGAGALVLQAGESLEVAAEVDADGADFGSVLFTTASDASTDIPGRIVVTGDVHALSSALEDFSADVSLEACDIEIATGGSVTKAGPASRILLRASGSTRIAGTLDADSGTNELQYRDLSRPPLILPGASLTPAPLITATPADPLRPCACTLDAGAPGLLCNDGNPCTQETCDAELGCTSVPLAGEGIAGCDDGNVCTGRETCEALACVKGPAPAADDGDPCTDDGVCDPLSGYPRTPKTGLEAAACRMDRIEAALAVADIPEDLTLKAFDKIGGLARSIRSLVRRADKATGRRRAKLLRGARRKVARLERLVVSPKSHVSPALAQLFNVATSETRAVLGF